VLLHLTRVCPAEFTVRWQEPKGGVRDSSGEEGHDGKVDNEFPSGVKGGEAGKATVSGVKTEADEVSLFGGAVGVIKVNNFGLSRGQAGAVAHFHEQILESVVMLRPATTSARIAVKPLGVKSRQK
jgi:hypothetical protein